MVDEIETKRRNEKFELFGKAIDFQRLWWEAIKHAEDNNLPIPDPIPHPDHIKLNTDTGAVKFTGPMTKDKKKYWDSLVARKLSWLEEINNLQEKLSEKKYKKYKKVIKSDIEHAERMVDLIRKLIPDDMFIPPSTYEYIKENPDCIFYELT